MSHLAAAAAYSVSGKTYERLRCLHDHDGGRRQSCSRGVVHERLGSRSHSRACLDGSFGSVLTTPDQ